MARFFIDRPVFAWVVAIVIMLAGGVALLRLPIAQYPDVAPPTVVINATYPGASAEVLENSVTRVIEQQLTGLDGLLYFSSSSTSAGQVTIEVSFALGTNADTAQVQVQNKVQQALSRLPTVVQQLGLTVTKSQPDYLLIVVLHDETNRASGEDVADYLASNFQDSIARVSGVGGVMVFGAPYAMRIWLDPTKLVAFGLNPRDVTDAISSQNVEVSAGQVGATPAPKGQQFTVTVTARSKLQTVQEFEDVILKYNAAGATVRIGDVARVELGGENYNTVRRHNRHPAAGLAVQLSPGANALETAKAVRAEVAGLAAAMPAGYKVAFARDSTDFIELSIKEVVKTLFEAIVLVVLVMYLFLQNFRATLVPTIAVPVVLLGTFGILAWFGYSINTLTMFGLVLSIGLLVDDAIVVVENVERVMEERKCGPREATRISMDEITSALVGIAAVVSAVFLPMAFFMGSTGVIYRQFSITIVASMVLSVIVAVVLTPALCATMLKPQPLSTRGFFGWYNRSFDAAQNRYMGGVRGLLRRPILGLLAFGAVVVAVGVAFERLPEGFLPNEDQGQVIVQFTLPPGATFERTVAVAEQIEDYLLDHPDSHAASVFTISGFNFSGRGEHVGLAFINLKPWSERIGPEASAEAVAARVTQSLAGIRDAQVIALTPSPVRGLGRVAGFELQLQARPGTSRQELIAAREALLDRARADARLDAVRLGSVADAPQLHVDIDAAKVSSFGLKLEDVNHTLSSAWGGKYVNDFVHEGRVKGVYVQGDAPFRSTPEDLSLWHVRGEGGEMTPFSAFADVTWVYGPGALTRYNGLATYPFQGQASAGHSSGEAMARLEALVDELPQQVTSDWSGLSYQQRLSQGQGLPLYALAILVVFLCLAALYESWSVPFCVILVVPLGLLGATLAVLLRGLENDVYFQVALLTTIGLSARNAILIVEFADSALRAGQSPMQAAIEGARLRLRPILMTAISFVAGVLPLALATGAGANSRKAIGTGIVGGTLSATFLSIFLVPLFFVLIQRILGRKPDEPAGAHAVAGGRHD